MKMKKACEATTLTERAIRLYISKGLIVPQQRDGLIDFSAEDITLLQDIALLRQMDFSIEQIAGMLSDAQNIPAIIAARRDAARAAAERENQVCEALTGLESASMSSLHAMTDGIRAQRVVPALNFTQFDELNDEERQQESSAAMIEVDRQQKRKTLLHRLGWTAFIIVVITVAAMLFLHGTRVDGYISIAPVEVLAVQGETATFRIGNERAVEVLGRDTITVPYMKDGFPPEELWWTGNADIKAGDVFDSSCQLAVKLTNLDLIRMGVSPIQSFTPDSVQKHNFWIMVILHSLFETERSDDCHLWIRYPADTKPLLWYAE